MVVRAQTSGRGRYGPGHALAADHYWAGHHKDWSKCDTYGLESLAIHLHQAQQSKRLAELINPDWMHVRVLRENSQYSGFVADLTLAWERAREEALRQIEEDDREFAAFATCFRYALIRTSINSLSKNYPLALMKRALAVGLWSVERVLDVAARIPVPKELAALYAMRRHGWNRNQFRTDTRDHCAGRQTRRRGATS